MKKYIISFIWLIVLAGIFGAGYLTNELLEPSVEKVEGLSNKNLGKPTDVDFSLFWDSWNIVEQNYVNRDNLDKKEMVYGAISGMLKSLEDPYTVFMKPKKSKKFLDNMSGSFDGIGAEVGIRDGLLTIISPLQDNPADKAGLKPGDKVLEVNGTSTTNLTLDESVDLIRGKKGTGVKLLIGRKGWDKAKEFNITRGNIKIPIIEWKIKENNIAYIKFNHFTENSPQDFKETIQKALERNPKGLILDLRNNPGGYLNASIEIASWFLPAGDVVVTEDFGDDNKNNYRSYGYGLLKDMPTTVLINQGSASASEILAGAIRPKENVTIVGEQSFGKGSVQQLKNLKDGSSLKLTVAKWLTPTGKNINKEGIKPEVKAELTEEDVQNMNDSQLEKAIEILKN